MLLSIIVPAYRQEDTIKTNLVTIEQALTHLRYDYELVCVVDGVNRDKTYQRARQLKSNKLTVIGYPHNRGKGYAVRYGMARTRGNLVAFIDAGGELDPAGISLLLEHMLWYDSDIIVGSIRHSASLTTGYPKKRRFLSWGYHHLTHLLFGLRITDSQRGLKIFKRPVLEKVLPRLLVKEYAFDIEMLAVAHRLGFTKIHDGPVKMVVPPGHLSSVTTGTIFSVARDTAAVFYRLKVLKYYDPSYRRRQKLDPELQFKINLG